MIVRFAILSDSSTAECRWGRVTDSQPELRRDGHPHDRDQDAGAHRSDRGPYKQARYVSVRLRPMTGAEPGGIHHLDELVEPQRALEGRRRPSRAAGRVRSAAWPSSERRVGEAFRGGGGRGFGGRRCVRQEEQDVARLAGEIELTGEPFALRGARRRVRVGMDLPGSPAEGVADGRVARPSREPQDHLASSRVTRSP